MSLQFKKFSKILLFLGIVLGLLVSIYSGWFTYQYYQEKEHARLDSASNEITLLIQTRMATYEQVLRSGVGLFNASDNVSRNEWAIFVKEQKLDENFKGIQALGYSEVVFPKNKQKYEERIRKEGFADFKTHPEGERELYIFISYLEPFDERNKRALGYDMFSEKVRIESLTKTIQSGEATLSGKIKLVQEYGKDIQAGLLMTLPVYKKGFRLDASQDKVSAIQGFVYAVFRVNNLMDGILGTMFPNIDIEIYDGDFVSKENMLYDSNTDHKDIKLYKRTTVTISGHTWTLLFQTKSVLEREHLYIIFLIPSLGLILTLLLYLFLNSLIKTKETAIEMAKEATGKFRSLVESTSDWIWEVDSKGIYTYVSPQVETLLGYKPQEIMGKSPFDLMSAEEAQRVGNIFTQLVGKQAPLLAIKNTNICKDGSIKILETNGAPFFSENGELLGYRGIDRDITEREHVEQILRESEEKFRSITTSAQDAIIMMNSEGIISYWNVAAEKIFGYTQEEAVGNVLHSLITPERFLAAHNIGFSHFKKTGEGPLIGKTIEVAAFRKDGTEFPVEISISATMVDGLFNAIGIIRDISERKEMQKELHQKEELMIAQSRQAAMGEMISMIAHQWRQPLTVISMAINNLKVNMELEEEITPEQLNKMGDTIQAQTKHLSTTIDDFSNFFKPNKEKQTVFVCTIIESAVGMVQKSFEKSNIALDINTDCNNAILTFPNELLQVFLNLINNAKDVLREPHITDAKMHIRVSEDDEFVAISICDNGGGIPEKILEHLGEPYVSSKIQSGRGLGIYMSKIIVEKHLLGSLYWENINGGACFIIKLPLHVKV
jgi:PAS domain S-box-containing protein